MLVATGNKGKIYRLSGDPYQPTLVTRANAEQVTTLGTGRDGRIVFATSNPARCSGCPPIAPTAARTPPTCATRRPSPRGARMQVAGRGTAGHEGRDLDAIRQHPHARRNMERLERRRTPTPKAAPSPARAPAICSGGRCSPARAATAPLLTSVTAAYLPRNLRPRVTSITIHPPGTVFQRPFPTDPGNCRIRGRHAGPASHRAGAGNPTNASPNIGRRSYEKGLLTFVWRAEDDNRDELSYDVQYRREGETAWKLLKRGARPIRSSSGTRRRCRTAATSSAIVASDAPSNSPATALTGAMESTAFDIDNAPPVDHRDGRSGARAKRTTIAFDVVTTQSAVQKAEYSLDGDRWQTIYPKDGIADSRFEQFELVLEGDAARGVIVRAADALNNVASASADVPTPATPSGRR